ncbi:gluconate-6-phosphate dehydrogenase, decarboxylating [Xenorhabdus nematophila ATCC 19061]|uniref:6-phosphogluconate dehydrogenase, decarboxylating n=1 Tax=Xenorhabdus nematophila (strain ATCC 19061 / DSM 3370 / CCUG 14189 / LMG 1036 / NCIMB 9965 / AN6) TaxID=406817 RepID=D3VBC8_XENNA|nr:NADP-dependent phosphogluconate dehydrogenase [Xenorhabdus nematophila]CBJ89567.1 gluconate-6-phosphate dehydrogenase, decarboxylating [Xenorhabdus nematophila ATCC 19061]CEE94731.1 gluconate-6-phosphate dehydrogenase, decarboxylating [Xenorhabdus nematophila str. Anatoliense]CEE95658.1 gluconate-6-phosphate dehydrogenase, decarboxylating [Xenorhabdus nematophila str. Anatoliense]CEK22459.1 gluconate-6-phosphate dehydrogenase, decarboxylating [Xenorhabdus nematophila AN6/1]
MSKQQIGVVGMAVMGRNLALNIESRGYSVSIFNRSSDKTDEVIAENPGKKLVPSYSIEEFVDSLEKPRRILLMVKAGEATDKTIASLTPHLDKGDILIDGGNTYFQDTIRRNRELSAQGFNFIGTGVSGGEEGALKGPSIMPGGQKDAYELVAPILKEIAAQVEGEPCVTYIGADGAGHYVKMVHNGIEYGDMQLIAEAYSLLKNSLNLSNQELSEIFSDWNQGELSSYLIEITADIFRKQDEEGKYLVDVILDEAANKGTGKWTSQSSLDLGVPVTLITESVFARYISSMKDQRVAASNVLSGPEVQPFNGDKAEFIEKVRRALYLGKIVSYAQGFQQLKAASDEYNWDLNYGEIAKIFRAGCIIRAQFLQKITDAYNETPAIANLLLAPYFKQIADEYQQALRDVISYGVQNGIPTPTFSAAISYYDSYRSAVLPANLIQAQRDYFGAHTYKRTDKEGVFHTEWLD